MYCWRTKKFVSSIGLVPLVVSLSVTVTVAVFGEPSAAPLGLLRLIVKLHCLQHSHRQPSGTENVLNVSPAANVRVPSVLM